MEACVVICRTQKPPERQGRILFIDAVREVAREYAQSFLKPEHQEHILKAYQAFDDEPGFALVANTDEVLAKDGNLSIPSYVRPFADGSGNSPDGDLKTVWSEFEVSGREFWQQMDALVDTLDGMIAEKADDV
jgi:type I restriction enzyme M protein